MGHVVQTEADHPSIDGAGDLTSAGVEEPGADVAHRSPLDKLSLLLIRQRMLQQCQQANSPYCILMVPLLFENNLQSLVQQTLVIDVDEATQIRRTMLRDKTTEEQVKDIITTQCSRQQRLTLADDVIVNTDDVTSVQRQSRVISLHQTYLSLASQH